LVNGTLAHALDFDDHGHLSTHTLPAALAVGEARGSNGAQLLLAYVVGREVGARLTQVVEARRKQGGGPTYRGWYRVGVIGPIAAAVSAGKLISLDADRLATAIGIAATSSAGLRRNQGTMAKALHAGNAASDGVHAALLAERGFTADPEILEAPLGLVNALCLADESDWAPIPEHLGRPWDLEQPVGIKPFPSCTPSHAPIDAALALRQQAGFSIDEIAAVESDLRTFSLFRTDPRDSIAAGFSLPYLLSVALIDGQVGLDQLSEARLHAADVRSLMAKVRPSDARDGQKRLTVRLRDGRTMATDIGPERDLHVAEEVEAKYRACAGRLLSSSSVERLYDLVLDLENVARVEELSAVAAGLDQQLSGAGRQQGRIQDGHA
jgi:2-methylcitrate dehydratase PrpD